MRRRRAAASCSSKTSPAARSCSSICSSTRGRCRSPSGSRLQEHVRSGLLPHRGAGLQEALLLTQCSGSTSRSTAGTGATPPHAEDQQFGLNMKTEEEEEAQNDQESSGPSESLVCPDVLQLNEDAVGGLINSDGEEEDWRPLEDPGGGGGGAGQQAAADGGNRKHCCPVCGRDCFKASALQKHLRIHSGERPFQCPTCRKSFTQQVHMTEHQRIHSGEKPYACAACGKSFTFSSALRRHQRLHADARPYQCGVCQKSFKQQSSLRSHQLTHSGVRHPCPLCSKSFSRALELSYHVDVHSAAQPYFCGVCRKNLSSARIFQKHMKKHEKQKTPQPLLRARPTHADSCQV